MALKNDHIAIFLPSLMGGGAERMMVNIANEFSKQGYQVDLVLAQLKGPYLSHVSGRVRLIDLQSSRVIKSLIPLTKYIRQEKPNVLLSAMNYANVIAIISKLLSFSTTKVFISERSILSQSLSKLDKTAALALRTIIKLTYPLADKNICISKSVENDLIKTIRIKNSKLTTIYNPVIDDYFFKKSQENIDHPWFNEEKFSVILGVGRFFPVKGFTELIKSFKIVNSAKKNTKLIILGDGPLRVELETLVKELKIEEDVFMPGFVNNPYPYMKMASVFVLSSHYEGFGNVLVEAMACGTSVISTNCPGGPSEILEDGKWGKLVPLGDINAMANAIFDTLSNSKSEKNNNSYERAMHFKVETIANLYLKEIKKRAYLK